MSTANKFLAINPYILSIGPFSYFIQKRISIIVTKIFAKAVQTNLRVLVLVQPAVFLKKYENERYFFLIYCASWKTSTRPSKLRSVKNRRRLRTRCTRSPNPLQIYFYCLHQVGFKAANYVVSPQIKTPLRSMSSHEIQIAFNEGNFLALRFQLLIPYFYLLFRLATFLLLC